MKLLDCEKAVEAIERNYYEWGRGRPQDSGEPNWFRANSKQRCKIARRGYDLYDGLPQRAGNEIDQLDVYVSVGINSRVLANDVVRFLIRTEQARPLLAALPDDALLEAADNDDQIDTAAKLISLLSAAYQVKWGKATKVLHKKRPGFIPVLDRVVVDYLWNCSPVLKGGYTEKNALKILQIFKALHIEHQEELEKIRTVLGQNGFQLSTVRLLDYLIWLEANSHREKPKFFVGCLLGGAVGDALGAEVEFMSLPEIRERFGPRGIQTYPSDMLAYGKVGAITDDTQMTLFTAEGLLHADKRRGCQETGCLSTLVHHAYLRWLETQGEQPDYPSPEASQGWLSSQPALHARRAPGNTCLTALRTGKMGTLEEPINDSKGCGGVMRVAPVGLVKELGNPFTVGCELAAITHGHPSGFLAAGFFAAVIASIIRGVTLEQAIACARDELRERPNHQEGLRAVDLAMKLAESAPVSPESVETLGAGWVAEEALAIALFCSLTADSFEGGVTLAVNHSGDSDSTGSMTGNILGALLGRDAIPSRWLKALELRDVVEKIAADLFHQYELPPTSWVPQLGVGDARVSQEADWAKYPEC